MNIMAHFALINLDFGYQLGLFALIAAYSLVGVLIMLLCVFIVNYVFKFDLKKELLHDQNQALGAMFGGLFVAIAIIIAASIVG